MYTSDSCHNPLCPRKTQVNQYNFYTYWNFIVVHVILEQFNQDTKTNFILYFYLFISSQLTETGNCPLCTYTIEQIQTLCYMFISP